MRLQDKVCVITGGAQGIGRATAMKFAEHGAVVAVVDVAAERAEATASEIRTAGGRAMGYGVDVVDYLAVEALMTRIETEHGPIEVLVNNAGIVRDAQLYKLDPKDFDAVVDVNLKGVFHCTRAVVNAMRDRGRGVILNAASVVALYGNFGQSNYVAAKAGVIGMTQVWARELGPKGIRVNAVAPGFIETRMTEGIPDKVMDKLLERVPLRRMGTPDDIANAYLFLASDDAAYVTGAVLSVDGGCVI